MLVPFGVLAVGVLMVVGFSGLAYHLGRIVTGKFGWAGDNVYLTVTLGVVAIMAVTLVARDGKVVQYGAVQEMPAGDFPAVLDEDA